MASIAINGLGRIGRAALKIIEGTGGAEVVAVNDLIPPDNPGLPAALRHRLRALAQDRHGGRHQPRWPRVGGRRAAWGGHDDRCACPAAGGRSVGLAG
jgi:hypothetical protein